MYKDIPDLGPMTPRAHIFEPKRSPSQILDARAIAHARRTRTRAHDLRCSGVTGTYTEVLFSNRADHTASHTTAVEASLLAGTNLQPWIPAMFFDSQHAGRSLLLEASGVLSTTGTPTIIFQVRFGTTIGSAYLSGTSVGVTAAITTQNGVTNKYWNLLLRLTCTIPGSGTGACTLSGAGKVESPTGFASPFVYPVEPTTPDTGTWTAAMDNSLAQHINLSATWSASSASNTITCKQIWLWSLN